MKPWFDKKFLTGFEFPNLPYLIDGDFRLTESKSIMTYLCQKHRPAMLGRTAAELATADMVSRVHDDLHSKIGKHCFKAGDTPELQADVASAAKRLSAFLDDKKYMVGDQLTFVDFSIYELLDHFNHVSKGKTFDDFPNLGHFFQRV